MTDSGQVRDVLAIVDDLRRLKVPESALRPIVAWERERQRLSRFTCLTCKDTGWVPSGCECHSDPCPRHRAVDRGRSEGGAGVPMEDTSE